VVVEELVGEHESSDEEPELAAVLTAEAWVLRLESVDVEKGEDDDRLGHLCGVEHVADKVGEAAARKEAESAGVVGAFPSARAGAARVDGGSSVSLDGVVKIADGEGDCFR